MDKRGIILECAAELFYQKGYDAVGVQEIANCAGITKPTLYYYFKSKYGLLESILETYYSTFLDQLEETAVYQGDLPRTLQQTCKEYLNMSVKNRKLYFLTLSLMYSAKENDAYRAIKPYMYRTHEIIVGIFEKAADSLGNMNGRQQQFASGFEGIVNCYLMYYFEVQEPEIDIDEVSKSLVHQFMYGIYS